MTTDRQKSFIATLSTSNLLHFLDVMYGGPATVASSLASGGFFTGRPQTRDDSHLLGLRRDLPADTHPKLVIYFRHTRSSYRLYIRTPGTYYGMCISVNDGGLLGAFASVGSKTFNLIDANGATINLDTISKDNIKVYLQIKHSGLVHQHKVHDSQYHYFADLGGVPMPFNLQIQQRNAPYLGDPDEV